MPDNKAVPASRPVMPMQPPPASPPLSTLLPMVVDGKWVTGIPSKFGRPVRVQFVDDGGKAGPRVALWFDNGRTWLLPVTGSSFNGGAYQWQVVLPVGWDG
jgi:hypothetical protein